MYIYYFFTSTVMVIIKCKQFDSAYNYKAMLNLNQPVKNLAVDVFIAEESPFEYVKTPGFSDDMFPAFDPNTVPVEPPKSSKITFRFYNSII